MNDIHQKLEAIYKATGMNANSISKKLGFASSYIYKLEKGESQNPSMEFLIKLEKELGVSMRWFAMDEGEMMLRDNVSSTEPDLWKDLKVQFEKRIQELEIFKLLYCKEKGINFLDVSEVPPVAKSEFWSIFAPKFVYSANSLANN